MTSPDTSATQNNQLIGVGCADATECWAVGWYNNGSVDQVLIEENTGSGWSIVTSPDSDATQNNYLFSVTCPSLSDCWAVGYYTNATTNQTLIEHYDGTSWTISTSPDTSASESNVLYGVSCVTSADCWAAGDYNHSGSDQTLLEHYNGSSWSIVGSPDTSASETNAFSGITCVSSTDCWAAGGYFNSGGSQQTLIEHYDGSTWSIVSSPDTSTTANDVLFAVACGGASQCWVAGYSNSTGTQQTLIEEYNGTSWSIASAPDTSPTEDNYLFGLTCAGAGQCVAVGDYTTAAGNDQTLIEENTGSGWTIDSSPDTSTTDNNDLNGVTCTAVDTCLAVGTSFTTDGSDQTLIEQSSTFAASVPEWPAGGAVGIALGALVLLASLPRLRATWRSRTVG